MCIILRCQGVKEVCEYAVMLQRKQRRYPILLGNAASRERLTNGVPIQHPLILLIGGSVWIRGSFFFLDLLRLSSLFFTPLDGGDRVVLHLPLILRLCCTFSLRPLQYPCQMIHPIPNARIGIRCHDNFIIFLNRGKFIVHMGKYTTQTFLASRKHSGVNGDSGTSRKHATAGHRAHIVDFIISTLDH